MPGVIPGRPSLTPCSGLSRQRAKCWAVSSVRPLTRGVSGRVRLHAAGLSFCVLYTDLSNPPSNSIYQKIGYARIADVVDVEIEGSAVE